MTEINFYKLTRSSIEKLIPRLLEKILKENSRVLFLFKEEKNIIKYDEFLWTYKNDSFIPHSTTISKNFEFQPIILSLSEENCNDADIILTIDGCVPNSIENYKKFIDIFDGQNKNLYEEALSRIENLSNKGYKVNCWTQSASGWVKNVSF